MNIEKRFWSKVKKTNKCWNWVGAINSSGYGLFNLNNKIVSAHRVSYSMFNGEIKNNLLVLHKCDNRRCVNPSHLFLGTVLENNLDKIKKGRDGSVSGEKHWNSRLTKIQVIEIHKLYNNGNETLRSLGKKFNVSPTMIGYIIKNKNWKNICI